MLAIHKNNVSDEWRKNYYRKEGISQYEQLNELAFSTLNYPQLAQQDFENGSWIRKCLPLYDDDNLPKIEFWLKNLV